MRIAYLVDVHDSFEIVPLALGEIGAVDLLLIGGDITTGGTPDDAARAIAEWGPLAPRLLAVAGNMDSAAIDERLGELGVALDGRGVVLDVVGVCGVSAAPVSPLQTPYELAEEELERRSEHAFADVAGSRVTVFCPHAPPRDTVCDRTRAGEHVGSTGIRRFVERAEPDLVLCGHIHEARGEDSIGRSRIVNPGAARDGHYAVLDVDDGVGISLHRL